MTFLCCTFKCYREIGTATPKYCCITLLFFLNESTVKSEAQGQSTAVLPYFFFERNLQLKRKPSFSYKRPLGTPVFPLISALDTYLTDLSHDFQEGREKECIRNK